MTVTKEYNEIIESLQQAKTRARANKRNRNQARAALRAQLAYRLTSPEAMSGEGVLEFMNGLVRDLELATETDAQTTLIADLINQVEGV